jgi:coenzyme F420-0:L-glutamate ligase / coenzyme F420-1:gamma-L-glutamate ligase
MRIEIVGLPGLPEVRAGDDLAALIREAADRPLEEVIVVVAQKIVSKAEGAIVDLNSIEPSPFAAEWAARWEKDARLIELILRESRRIVKMERGLIIAETHHGFVAANAGVDESNIPGGHCASILPRDPDASARRLRDALGCGAVIISDTFGRPWREGLVNVAIGVAGLEALEDYRGKSDRAGRALHSTVIAVADELAAAAGLVMRKQEGVPVALVTGLDWTRAEGSAAALIRPPEKDLFR